MRERCKTSDGALAHQFWQCSETSVFCWLVFRCSSLALKVNIDADPETALFAISKTLDVMVESLIEGSVGHNHRRDVYFESVEI